MSLLGKLIYNFYHKPKSELKKIAQQGGIINSLEIEKCRKEMVSASNIFKVIKSLTDDSPVLHFLTGQKYWYQTAFCAYSLTQNCEDPIKFIFHDDGTFDQTLKNKAEEQFQGSVVRSIEEIMDTLSTQLPESKYPYLHFKRKVYPHIRKLTDIHTGSKGWKLLLDSDMLFFNYPGEMMEWLKAPQNPFFIQDALNSYHYSFNLMEELSGNKIHEKLNVGLIGLKSELIDWDKLEFWTKTLEEREGTSYYLEQALSAMLVAGQTLSLGNREDYIVLPTKDNILNKTGILHHYVAESKEWYFKEAWKNIIN